MFEYEHPHPAVTTDAVVFTIQDEQLKVLLIQRGKEPFKGQWAFPGGFVDIDEDLDECVTRELAEETGLTNIYLDQFQTFGKPGRDPRERIITVAYLALVPSHDLTPVAGDDAAEAEWITVDTVNGMAGDHGEILAFAVAQLRERLETTDVALGMMGDEFRLSELQKIYEVVLGESLNPDVFRDWVLSKGWLEQTG